MRNEADILALIGADPWMMSALSALRVLNLPDSWIGAGFVRSKVWDHLHGFTNATPLDDIDVLFHDPQNTGQEHERDIEGRLRQSMPGLPWSAKNQARMHLRNGDEPYKDTTDAMRYWLETPTCVAVQLGPNDALRLTAPYGIEDLLALVIRPTPAGRRRGDAYRERIENKNWLQNWPRTEVVWP